LNRNQQSLVHIRLFPSGAHCGSHERARSVLGPTCSAFACILALALIPDMARANPQTVKWEPFGPVTLYQTTAAPSRVVLFLSGLAGWNSGVVKTARDLAAQGALVVGIDTPRYLWRLSALKTACIDPGADLDRLSRGLQRHLGFPRYIRPVIMGYSGGAWLSYAALALAPPGTFAGAVSMGFCPELTLTRPFCLGEELVETSPADDPRPRLKPVGHLQEPWIVLQGALDSTCDVKAVEAFVRGVENGEIVVLPKVGAGFSRPEHWMPQLTSALALHIWNERKDRLPIADEVKDLPMIVLPAVRNTRSTLALLVSGEDGWTGINRELGRELAAAGIPVLGLDLLNYSWTPRSPEAMAADMERVLSIYASRWRKDQVVIIGYGSGADLLPFFVNRFSSPMSQRTVLLVLVNPGQEAVFEASSAAGDAQPPHSRSFPVLPEAEKLSGVRVLCIHEDPDEDNLCSQLKAEFAWSARLNCTRFSNTDCRAIARAILDELRE